MARNVVRTWIHRTSGQKTNRLTLRIEYHMDLNEMIDGLCSKYAPTSPTVENAPESLTGLKISDIVREEYSYHGVGNVGAWVDGIPSEEAQAWRRWAEGVIVEALPPLGEYR